ncbi:cyclic nucleotide-binding domain-containing protein [Brasilonema bromeliae]|uniref:Cyclic nucleotide-binding domain-containing protein n=1 Tax=Brasilonema bromeliae SPC951 TaxID=385972 RepID=A0ABX1PCL5_9CYAN|nr:cyclic nucleotide-binding domain-containing protein [Brasilonema bromeliae]NMG22228.1 hypothetical protein [Brasilonema bromeliae SPC951]
MTLSVAVAKTEAELNEICHFRYRIYVKELKILPPEADHSKQILRDSLDDYGVSYALLKDGQVVGSLRSIFLKDVPNPKPLINKFNLKPAIETFGTSAIITTSRFILDPQLRHGSAVFRLIEAGYKEGRSRGVRLNYGDCSPYLLPFYEHLGYSRYISAYNDSSFGYKFPLLMLVGDHAWFERVHSPLRRLAFCYPQDTKARQWFESTYPEYFGLESAPFLPEKVFFDTLSQRLGNNPLRKIFLLRGLDQTEANLFLKEATIIKTSPGDCVVRQGNYDKTFYVMLSGIAEVIDNQVPDHPAKILSAGELFVENHILTPEPCAANLIACSVCNILVVPGEFFGKFCKQEPIIASKILLNLVQLGLKSRGCNEMRAT